MIFSSTTAVSAVTRPRLPRIQPLLPLLMQVGSAYKISSSVSWRFFFAENSEKIIFQQIFLTKFREPIHSSSKRPWENSFYVKSHKNRQMFSLPIYPVRVCVDYPWAGEVVFVWPHEPAVWRGPAPRLRRTEHMYHIRGKNFFSCEKKSKKFLYLFFFPIFFFLIFLIFLNFFLIFLNFS